MNTVALAILNWNGRKYLETYLPSVIKHTAKESVRIYVIDNASTDDSLVFLRERYPQVLIIELDRNYGFAGGYNRGLRQIEAGYYLLLNSDVEVTPGWIHPMLDILRKDGQVVACMPRIKSYLQRSGFEYAGAAGGYMDRYGYTFCRGRIFGTVEEDRGQYDDSREVFWATGACLMIKSVVFHRSGGFDELFFAHMEEIDLCWRLHHQGYKIYFVHDATVYHLGGGTLSQQNPRKTYLNYRNNLLLLYKNLPDRGFYPLMIKRLLLDYLSLAFYVSRLEFRNILAVFRAHLAFFRLLKTCRPLRRQLEKSPFPGDHKGILNKSLVFQYFVKGRKTFTEMMD